MDGGSREDEHAGMVGAGWREQGGGPGMVSAQTGESGDWMTRGSVPPARQRTSGGVVVVCAAVGRSVRGPIRLSIHRRATHHRRGTGGGTTLPRLPLRRRRLLRRGAAAVAIGTHYGTLLLLRLLRLLRRTGAVGAQGHLRHLRRRRVGAAAGHTAQSRAAAALCAAESRAARTTAHPAVAA
jgi:hypothetical protein